jgi:hypothetical protein
MRGHALGSCVVVIGSTGLPRAGFSMVGAEPGGVPHLLRECHDAFGVNDIHPGTCEVVMWMLLGTATGHQRSDVCPLHGDRFQNRTPALASASGSTDQ